MPFLPPSEPSDVPVTDHEARDALDRVLASPPLRASGRMTAFLRFVVDETLAGRAEHLKEQTIAVGALGRPAEFDPRFDPVVRVQAGRVRAALERYYRTTDDPVRLLIPRGGYRPLFERRHRSATPEPVVQGPVVAVMRFDDLSSSGEIDPMRVAIPEALAAVLGRFPGLRVVGPVAASSDDPTQFDALRDRYHVQYALTGTCHRMGRTHRVVVRLVHLAEAQNVWAAVFDHDASRTSGFEAVDEIVRHVTAAVGDFKGAILRRPLTFAGPTDRLVHDAVVRYFDWVGNLRSDDYGPTLDVLDAAVQHAAHDPLVVGMAACVHATAVLTNHTDDPAGSLYRADELAQRAHAADREHPLPLLALAVLALLRRDLDECRARARAAADSAPHHPTVLYAAGHLLATAGEWDEGVSMIREAVELNPRHPGYYTVLVALDHWLGGEDDEALAAARDIEVPGSAIGPILRAVAWQRLGQLDRAAAEYAVARDRDPRAASAREEIVRTAPFLPEPVRQLLDDSLARLESLPAES